MKVDGRIVVALACFVLNAGRAVAQVINLGDSGPGGAAIQWQGPQVNARAGASLLRADMSGDGHRVDLVVGAPGAGPPAGRQAHILFTGPTHTPGDHARSAPGAPPRRGAGG